MNDSKQPDFETSLQQLEAVVERLETEQLGLDASLKLYQDGMGLVRQCRTTLDEAKQIVEMVDGEENNGNDLINTDEANETKQPE